MPSRILVHPPEPEPSHLVDKLEHRPEVGALLLPGWKACDYSLIRGNFDGEEYEYEVWVMPASSDSC
jgi:hypothetical protein